MNITPISFLLPTQDPRPHVITCKPTSIGCLNCGKGAVMFCDDVCQITFAASLDEEAVAEEEA